ncbi:MAG: PrsW family intramembrane metalloprotease [Ardenticatenia bacterium]|nr:PrsW family intramembrane metalloprotease [Ardenticatenia bacterium]
MVLLALLLTILAAAVPSLLYTSIAWWLDRYEKEPWWVLVLTFFWGAVPAIVLALVVEVAFDIPLRLFLVPSQAEFFASIVVAPVVEELFKAVPLVLIFWLYRQEFDGIMDGLLYGALVGFGFAMTENIFYFLSALVEEGVGSFLFLVFLRAIVFGLNHALFSSAFGFGLGLARYARTDLVRWGGACGRVVGRHRAAHGPQCFRLLGFDPLLGEPGERLDGRAPLACAGVGGRPPGGPLNPRGIGR